MAKIKGGVFPGGGMRGYLSLAIIQKWERIMNTTVYNYFDIGFGQSTGSLLGTLLFGGISSSENDYFYKSNGKHIFTPQNSWWHPIDKLTQPVYDRNKVLEPYKEIAHGKNIFKFGDISKKFVVGSVNECTKQNVFFKTTSEKYKERNIEDIVVRSFAAPNYFGKYVDPVDGSVWSDGGSGEMNCPIIPCYLECLSMAHPDDEIEITVFGTGIMDYSVSCEEAKKYNRYSELWEFYLAKGEQLGRIQGYLDQVNAMNWISEHNPRVTFKLYNPIIPEKLAGIDGWQFMDQYKEIGESVVI